MATKSYGKTVAVSLHRSGAASSHAVAVKRAYTPAGRLRGNVKLGGAIHLAATKAAKRFSGAKKEVAKVADRANRRMAASTPIFQSRARLRGD